MPVILVIDDNPSVGTALDLLFSLHDIRTLCAQSPEEGLALLERACVLISPDSGPAHMATCAGTPVIGLYAASNPIRSGPYNSRQWCVDRYDAAARKFLGKPAAALPWGRKLEFPGVMDLIEPEAVTERLDALMAWRTAQGEA